MNKTRFTAAKKITLLGAIVNFFLGMLKLIGGIWFHSHALIADGVHSFADLLTDIMVIFASKYGGQPVDDSHPYGHQRIETAATLLLALLLILTGCGIIWDSMEILLQAYHPNPSICALPVALFSILANEGLFHYTRHIGERIQSQLIIANAWHHRSDAWSSFVVLVGLIGSSLHIPHLDPASALIVGGMIIYMGWNYGWDSVKQLVDTAVEQNVLHTIEQAILQVNGVKKIHQLRTRSMGQDILIDVHILVAPYISVSEGHYIAQHVHRHLCRTIAKVSDVTVHVDPEDDEANCPSFHLPNRAWLEKHLLVPWQQTYPDIQYWLLHYLDGEVIIDLWTNNTQHIRQALQNNIHKDLQNKANHIKIRCLINNEVC